jgi:hypothetical protein
MVLYETPTEVGAVGDDEGEEGERDAKKKKPTPKSSEDSAVAALQLCPEQ